MVSQRHAPSAVPAFLSRVNWPLCCVLAGLLLSRVLVAPSAVQGQDGPPPLDASAGLAAYQHFCLACHNEQKKVGPDMLEGAEYFIRAGVAPADMGKLLFPKVRMADEGSVMPAFSPEELSDLDILNIGFYLAGQVEEPAAGPLTGVVDNGAELFTQQCALCHGEGAMGTSAVPPLGFTAAGIKAGGLEQSALYGLVLLACRSGDIPLMPVYTENQLSDQELADIAAWLWETAPELE